MAMIFQASLQLRHSEGINLGRKFDYVADTTIDQFMEEPSEIEEDQVEPE